MFAQNETRGLQLRLGFSEFFIVLNTSCPRWGVERLSIMSPKSGVLYCTESIKQKKHITISERGAIMIDGDCFGSWS